MKKHKKTIIDNSNIQEDKDNKSLFIPEIKSSRITINSRICNNDKFNELFSIIDNTKDYKNIISQYCYDNLTSLVSNYSQFLINYKLFDSNHLNSWEAQTIYQEIAGHYSETAQRYLDKAQYKVYKPKTNISNIATFINYHSNLIKHDEDNKLTNQKKYVLKFNIQDNLIQLNDYLNKYINDLTQAKLNIPLLTDKKEIIEFNKEISSLEKKIISYHKLIATYKELEVFSLSKPFLYNRIINLITTKKLRLLTYVKLGVYNTGTHTRNFNNGQVSIVKDLTNTKYQYFLKVRKLNKLTGREPKLTIKNKDNYPLLLERFNDTNFIYLPLIYNEKKLKEIDKTMENLLTKDNPQIVIKSEQLRINKSSRKIHIIFTYEQKSNLGKVIDNSIFNKTNNKININVSEINTIGVDINLKNNLLADSNGIYYDQILKNNLNNKNKFIENINEIVLLHSKEIIERTEKETYRYEKLLRINENLLKTYLSGIVKDWSEKNILHIVMEDLNFINDRSYYAHKEVKIKYTRLARLLRIGKIKHWIASMAEKKGMFAHIVNPAYTSQECSECHYISDKNRKSQEIFKCMNSKCNHEENADSNAAKVIKSRIINTNIRNKLGKDNVYLCSRTKTINYKLVKGIIMEEYKELIGVVTELLPDKSKIFK